MTKSDRILAALCYIPPLWPLPLVLLLLGYDRLRYHYINGLGFAVSVFLVGLLMMLVAEVPVVGALGHFAFWVAVVILSILYAKDAYNGTRIVIPVVTEFLKKNVKKF